MPRAREYVGVALCFVALYSLLPHKAILIVITCSDPCSHLLITRVTSLPLFGSLLSAAAHGAFVRVP